jgi:alginate O-acetyltransferase complex protein AlgI
MVFSSIEFLFLFLPIFFAALLAVTIALYPFKNGRRPLQNAIILLFSLAFYMWGEHLFVLVMIGSSLLDYVCGLIISAMRKGITGKPKQTSVAEKLAMAASIFGNLGVLAWFKYADFFIANVNDLFTTVGISAPLPLLGVILPLGISFYTFQSMSYTIDVYLGNVRPTKNLLNFLTYVTMFPQLVAGPIIRYRDVEEQLQDRRVTTSGFAYGVERFIIGLAKKVIIADTIARPVDAVFALPSAEVTFFAAWIAVLGYSLQIYFDFSGYSDMAIGLGHMLGFRFPENFNFPYIARSVQDFWRRWHISLSTWFRDYLYIPLGGSRGATRKTYRNLFIVFLLCGFWHGASWNFIVWGGIHGVFLTLERSRFGTWIKALPRFLQHAYTLIIATYAFVLFRAETFEQALQISAASLGFNGFGSLHYTVTFTSLHFVMFGIGCLFSAPLLRLSESLKGLDTSPGALQTSLRSLGIMILFVISLAIIAATTHQPFIYFRF